MGVSPFTVRVCPYLPLLFCASSMCVPCFCLSVPCVCVLVPFFVCGLCFSVWVCWVCVLLFLCSGVLVSSLGVYVSWYLCVLCVGGLVFVFGLCVLFPVVCGVLLDVFCVCVLCSCFLCGWSCLGLRVSLGCSVYVSVLLIVWCVLYVCAPLLGVLCALCVAWCLYWFVVFGVLVVGLCLCGCGGFRGLGVCCFLFLGFGLVLFFGWLLGFCFLLGGGVLVWLVVCFCWLFGWFLCVGGGWLRLIFWSYIICVDCGGALRVSACVGFLFGVTACFLGVCS